ncbi:hypothetical protein NKR23_g8201 [Pleurostoma richardsiae]|uniref:Uncharacterized protein n=1 Tax=Pleurostoma richardsiae TaxID=41990 RepID=A0AA38RJ56_9PEZI|nr:hypothetical protein NKR23_g8201 [Pleurostoma richardsiae]
MWAQTGSLLPPSPTGSASKQFNSISLPCGYRSAGAGVRSTIRTAVGYRIVKFRLERTMSLLTATKIGAPSLTATAVGGATKQGDREAFNPVLSAQLFFR